MKKYKIVLLSDLNDSTESILKSTVRLAEMVNGEIEIFSVRKPIDIVRKENQLSAMRTINDHHTVIDKKMNGLAKSIREEYGVATNYSFAFGNIKNEIGNFVKQQKPDILVLGKRNPNMFSFIGDGITQFVLKTFDGVIMIANDKSTLEPNKEISLGMLNSSGSSFQLEFAENLIQNTALPLKSFKIVKNSNEVGQMERPTTEKTVEYVFEQNDSSLKSLSNYLAKNNIDLLFLDRAKSEDDGQSNLAKSEINNLVNKLDVSLLVR